MIVESAGASDPETLRSSELFKTCREMGIIPSSESDLRERQSTRSTSNSSPSANKSDTEPVESAVFESGDSLVVDFQIGGLWCAACAWVVEEGVRQVPGVLNASCNFSTDRLRCRYDPLKISVDQITQTVGKLGYTTIDAGDDGESTVKQREFIRFSVSAFLTMNVMMLSFALYSGFFTSLSTEGVWKLSWPIFAMASVVVFYGGSVLLKKAWAGVRSRSPGMETLIAIGALSAYFFSIYHLAAGSIHLYFDTASMLITLVLLGKMIERRAKDAVQKDLNSLFSLRPTKARICNDANPDGRWVSAEQVSIGDVFRRQTAETAPADGVVIDGSGTADESSLTGEARPVAKTAGDRIQSGSVLTDGDLRIRADRVGQDATFRDHDANPGSKNAL